MCFFFIVSFLIINNIKFTKMGVDYSGHYGIGQQIKVVDFDENEKPRGFEEYLYELFDKKDETKGFSFFKVGEGNYTGKQDDLFIEVDNVFSDGLDLTGKKKLFDEFIKKHNFETIGVFGLIGGIEVW